MQNTLYLCDMMSRLCLLLIALLWLTACKESLPDLTSYPDTLEGRKQKMEVLNQYLKEHPDQSKAYFERAKVYEALGMKSNAVDDILLAIKNDSQNLSYYKYGGKLYEELPYMKGAIDMYEVICHLEPKNADNFVKLGKFYFYLKDRNNSLKNLEQAIKLNQYLSEPYYYRGLNFKEMQDIRMATISLQTAVELKNDYFDAFLQLGLINGEIKDSKAPDYYQRAISLKPDDIRPYYGRGYYYQMIDSNRLAIKDYEKLLSLDPSNRNALYNIAFIYFKEKKYNEAVTYFTKTIAVEPLYTEAFYGRGKALEALGKKKEAQEDLDKAAQMIPLIAEEKEFKAN